MLQLVSLNLLKLVLARQLLAALLGLGGVYVTVRMHAYTLLVSERNQKND